MGSAATCLTVPVESAPERQTKSLAPRPRRWSSAAWQEEKLAKPLSPLLYLQHPDDAPRDAGDDERWRKLDEELTAAKARALANTSARPAWLAEQPAEVQRRWDMRSAPAARRSLAVKTLTVAPAPAQPDAGAVLLQTVLRRRSHSGHASPSTLSPEYCRPSTRSPECSPGGSPLRREGSPKSGSFRSRYGSSRLVSFRRDGPATVPSPVSLSGSAVSPTLLNNLPTSPRSPKPFLAA